MANNEKDKSNIKDIAIVLSIVVPFLFIIIGGLIWRNNGFDGTVMEQLFPALFFGFLAAYAVLIILSNLFGKSTMLWVVGAIIIFAATVVFYMLELTSILKVGAIILGIGLGLLVLIKWIAGS